MSPQTFTPSAKIIKHAVFINPTYDPYEIITITGTFHRYVLSEFNTHRAFSRNSASSRAVPFEKMVEIAKTAYVYPIEWGKNQKGMSAGEELDYKQQITAIDIWEDAREAALHYAEKLNKLGLHKQVINRLLEPFLPHTVVFTTDKAGLDNFFNLRLSPEAQPEIREFAKAVKRAYDESTPEYLTMEHIYLPFTEGRKLRKDHISYENIPDKLETGEYPELIFSREVINSVATCARYSYLGHEKNQTDESNERLFYSLMKNKHMSPFEHVCFGSRRLSIEHTYSFEEVPMFEITQNLNTDYTLQLRTLIDYDSRLTPSQREIYSRLFNL